MKVKLPNRLCEQSARVESRPQMTRHRQWRRGSFLPRLGANGSAPSLDRELANEAEAMIESLKSGLTYYSVVEYRAVPDCSGKQPIVKRETVRRNG